MSSYLLLLPLFVYLCLGLFCNAALVVLSTFAEEKVGCFTLFIFMLSFDS